MDARKTGALITARRKALGLTQKELAERLTVSDKAVSKWETGAGYPEVTMLPLLAATLGITVDELLAGETRAEAAEEEPPAQAEPAGLTAALVVAGGLGPWARAAYAASADTEAEALEDLAGWPLPANP